jgi:GTPase SAR1 family protein
MVAEKIQTSGENMNNKICETSRIFRDNEREYLKEKLRKLNELETNSKNKNIRDLYRGINEFKKGYQPLSNLKKMRIAICLHVPC